jgi:hypothetical protein
VNEGDARASWSAFSTTDACEIPTEDSKNSDLTISGKVSRAGSRTLRPGRTTVKSGTRIR